MTKLIRLSELTNLVSLPRSSIYAKIARGEFPPPIKLGERASAWRADEIQTWIETRTRESRGGAGAAAT